MAILITVSPFLIDQRLAHQAPNKVPKAISKPNLQFTALLKAKKD